MRIVHLSDLHLRHHLPGSSTNPVRLSRAVPKLFERAIAQIVDLEPDLFVLSGDLLDYPLDSLDDPVLQDLAHKDMQMISAMLQPLACPTALVFGNHDHPHLFQQVFAPLPQEQVVDNHRVLTFLDCEGPGNVPVRATSEMSRFKQALATSSLFPQIHVQHYLVWPERNKDYPHTYGDGKTMHDDIVASGKVRLVLSGHYHKGVKPAMDKGVWFATVPAFGESPHPYWVYELFEDDLSWTQYVVA